MQKSIVIVVLLTWLSASHCANADVWKSLVGEDSDGPRCVVYSELENREFVYFTIISFSPLVTEFSFRFPSSTSSIKNPKVLINSNAYNIIQKGAFGWLEYKRDQKKLTKEIQYAKDLLVEYSINGRHIERVVGLAGMKERISNLSTACRLSS